jgi:ABC-type Mn2+/Zn2+ transport system ATPase subunit
MLARVFAWPADMTTMDEPDENLDAGTRELLERLARKRADPYMISIATHDMTLIGAASIIVDFRLPILPGCAEKS